MHVTLNSCVYVATTAIKQLVILVQLLFWLFIIYPNYRD